MPNSMVDLYLAAGAGIAEAIVYRSLTFGGDADAIVQFNIGLTSGPRESETILSTNVSADFEIYFTVAAGVPTSYQVDMPGDTRGIVIWNPPEGSVIRYVMKRDKSGTFYLQANGTWGSDISGTEMSFIPSEILGGILGGSGIIPQRCFVVNDYASSDVYYVAAEVVTSVNLSELPTFPEIIKYTASTPVGLSPIPVANDQCIVASSPTPSGAFVGYAKYVATYNGSSWTFRAPITGQRYYVSSIGDFMYYNGTAWVTGGIGNVYGRSSWATAVTGTVDPNSDVGNLIVPTRLIT